MKYRGDETDGSGRQRQAVQVGRVAFSGSSIGRLLGGGEVGVGGITWEIFGVGRITIVFGCEFAERGGAADRESHEEQEPKDASKHRHEGGWLS